MMNEMHGTTILCVKKGDNLCMAGDGQVTMNEMVIKHTARKVRKVYKDSVLVGFAGAVADAFALLERFEEKLAKYSGDLERSSYELAKDWRTDKILRKLEAMMIVADKHDIFLLSGSGEVIRPDEPLVAIGSGGGYAYAAARALYENTELSATEICKLSMNIASKICIYTNDNIIFEEITHD
ncbi:MAG TPA: ATP-dependent protease subunit HslV [Exilispira sp.]|nr:ATP-dependent protease subunit HslV [Exilispira sp.]HOV45708.1 ATP-dependent protease subunit HslV [Exilispira sp.]HPB47374.1 ATP-dependent protease subunit HslV [Exilispira sp.]HQM88842.1 ATP-dependent protease subunit HslV [Exilispira sp.]HQQ18814.1 ATP-dependent protease subunit HslV [Exilispira sp.]